MIQVYAARAVGWKGALGVHTWIAMKPSGAAEYTRYEVVGWGVDRGVPAIRKNRTIADGYWGQDGAFYFSLGQGMAFQRDDAGHIRRSPATGFHHFHGGHMVGY